MERLRPIKDRLKLAGQRLQAASQAVGPITGSPRSAVSAIVVVAILAVAY